MNRKVLQLSLRVLAVAVVAAAGCSTFEVEGLRSDGSVAWRVTERGAPLLNRKANFEVRHSWIDEATNQLHEDWIKRNSDENAQPQVEALKILTEALAAQTTQAARAAAAAP